MVMASKIMFQLDEWANLSSRNNGHIHDSSQTWQRPPIGWVKANTNGDFEVAHKFGVVGQGGHPK